MPETTTPVEVPATNPDNERLSPSQESIVLFLAGQPSHFVGQTSYWEVKTIIRALIMEGWMKNPTKWAEPGPGRDTIEYPLRDGWRLNLDFPGIDYDDVFRDRGAEMVRMEFLPPGMPSPAGTILVDRFQSSFAPEYLAPIHGRT